MGFEFDNNLAILAAWRQDKHSIIAETVEHVWREEERILKMEEELEKEFMPAEADLEEIIDEEDVAAIAPSPAPIENIDDRPSTSTGIYHE